MLRNCPFHDDDLSLPVWRYVMTDDTNEYPKASPLWDRSFDIAEVMWLSSTGKVSKTRPVKQVETLHVTLCAGGGSVTILILGKVGGA